jgi:hypothetical protein
MSSIRILYTMCLMYLWLLVVCLVEVRGTRSVTQQAEQPATSNIHAHRRDNIVTIKNHDMEAQQFPRL